MLIKFQVDRIFFITNIWNVLHCSLKNIASQKYEFNWKSNFTNGLLTDHQYRQWRLIHHFLLHTFWRTSFFSNISLITSSITSLFVYFVNIFYAQNGIHQWKPNSCTNMLFYVHYLKWKFDQRDKIYVYSGLWQKIYKNTHLLIYVKNKPIYIRKSLISYFHHWRSISKKEPCVSNFWINSVQSFEKIKTNFHDTRVETDEY